MIKRIGIYLNEMFPPSAFLGSILTAVAVQLVYLRLHEIRSESYFILVVHGIVITSISLLIRIMDEFKDYDDDLINFPLRPLPSGRVKKSDLKWLAFCCVMTVLFLSMSSTPLLIWAVITLIFTFFMLKWFFIEDRMRRSLPLALISHHPIVFINFMYLIIACMQMDQSITMDQARYILPLCLMFTNWEFVRKIRSPSQETGYTTYSKIFGPRPAIIMALVLQLTFIFTVFLIFDKLHTKLIIQGLFLLLQIVLVAPSVYFLFTLKLFRPLKPFAEAQILVVVTSLFFAAVL